MFSGLTARYSSAAIWAAENSAYYAESVGSVSDPIEAQRLHNEQQAAAAPPSDAPKVNTKTTQEFDSQRDAERLSFVEKS